MSTNSYNHTSHEGHGNAHSNVKHTTHAGHQGHSTQTTHTKHVAHHSKVEIDHTTTDFLLPAALVMISFFGCCACFARKMLSTMVYLSGFSFSLVLFYLIFNAPDVALTEVVIGIFMSSFFLLITTKLVSSLTGTVFPKLSKKILFASIGGFAVILLSLLALFAKFPPFGDKNNPAHNEVTAYYLQKSGDDIGIPNSITSILAAYRSFDTMGETTIIFTASLAVFLILRKNKDEDAQSANFT
jgi:multicomponent Na+:H+ antiporter subunit B